jgi:GABA permease
MRRQLEAQGVELKLKMWLFPWLTWAVIVFVIGALVTMTVEGTYRAEVLSTSCLAAVIVIMGLIAQRYGIGKGKAHTTKNSWVC